MTSLINISLLYLIIQYPNNLDRSLGVDFSNSSSQRVTKSRSQGLGDKYRTILVQPPPPNSRFEVDVNVREG